MFVVGRRRVGMGIKEGRYDNVHACEGRSCVCTGSLEV